MCVPLQRLSKCITPRHKSHLLLPFQHCTATCATSPCQRCLTPAVLSCWPGAAGTVTPASTAQPLGPRLPPSSLNNDWLWLSPCPCTPIPTHPPSHPNDYTISSNAPPAPPPPPHLTTHPTPNSTPAVKPTTENTRLLCYAPHTCPVLTHPPPAAAELPRCTCLLHRLPAQHSTT
jgi:hypothetical protein